MRDARHEIPGPPSTASPLPPVLAPVLMMVFWMLLGGAAGIKMMESIWRFCGLEVGKLTIAVPVGGAVGALAGALLGLINNPRLLVLLMAVFAGASAGGVAGQLPWRDVGQIGGQVVGGLVGGIAWAIWLLMGRSKRETAPQNGAAPALFEPVTEPVFQADWHGNPGCSRDVKEILTMSTELRPDRDAMNSEDQHELVRLAGAANPVLAHIWQQALEDEGIRSQVLGDYLDAGLGDIPGFSAEVWVERADFARSEAILRQHRDHPEEEAPTEETLS